MNAFQKIRYHVLLLGLVFTAAACTSSNKSSVSKDEQQSTSSQSETSDDIGTDNSETVATADTTAESDASLTILDEEFIAADDPRCVDFTICEPGPADIAFAEPASFNQGPINYDFNIKAPARQIVVDSIYVPGTSKNIFASLVWNYGPSDRQIFQNISDEHAAKVREKQEALASLNEQLRHAQVMLHYAKDSKSNSYDDLRTYSAQCDDQIVEISCIHDDCPQALRAFGGTYGHKVCSKLDAEALKKLSDGSDASIELIAKRTSAQASYNQALSDIETYNRLVTELEPQIEQAEVALKREQKTAEPYSLAKLLSQQKGLSNGIWKTDSDSFLPVYDNKQSVGVDIPASLLKTGTIDFNLFIAENRYVRARDAGGFYDFPLVSKRITVQLNKEQLNQLFNDESFVLPAFELKTNNGNSVIVRFRIL